MQKRFILVNVFKKMKYHFIPTVNMTANYTEICRVGNLEAEFLRSACLLVSEIFTILL